MLQSGQPSPSSCRHSNKHSGFIKDEERFDHLSSQLRRKGCAVWSTGTNKETSTYQGNWLSCYFPTGYHETDVLEPEVLTAVLLRSQVFWDVCLCRWVRRSPMFPMYGGPFSSMLTQSKNSYCVWTAWPWRWGTGFLRNVGNHAPNDTESRPRTPDSSDSQTFHNNFQIFLFVYAFFARNGSNEYIIERSCLSLYPPAYHTFKFNQWILVKFCIDDWDCILCDIVMLTSCNMQGNSHCIVLFDAVQTLKQRLCEIGTFEVRSPTDCTDTNQRRCHNCRCETRAVEKLMRYVV